MLEAARDEQEEALKQTAAYNSLRALAKASDDKDTAKLAKRLREEHKEWAKFLTDELKSLSKKLVKAESEEREQAASRRRSATAKKAASSRSSNGRKSSSRKSSVARKSSRRLAQVPRRARRRPLERAQVVGSTARKSPARARASRQLDGAQVRLHGAQVAARRRRPPRKSRRRRRSQARLTARKSCRRPSPQASGSARQVGLLALAQHVAGAAPPRAASRPAGYQPGVAAVPEHPTDLSGRRWWLTLKRTFSEFQEDNLTDWAAALTYYGLLALFPALIALVSIVGLVMDPETLTDALTDVIGELGPASAVDTFKGPIDSIAGSDRTGVVLLVVGVIGALFSASAYVGAFARASNEIYEIREGRPVYKLRPVQMLITLAMVLLLARRPGGAGDQRPDRRRAGRGDRPGRHRPHRVELRQVAGPAAGGPADDRRPLLHRPERQAAEVPVDLPRQRCSR